MKYLAAHENKTRGSLGFPFEFHHLTNTHPRYEMPFHWHNEYEFIRVVKGEFPLSVDEKTYIIQEGQSAIVVAGAIHGGSTTDTIYECVVFDYINICQKNYLEFAQTLSSLDKIKNHVIVFQENSLINNSINSIFELFQSEHISTSNKLKVLGYTLQIIGEILDTSTKYDSKPNNNIERMKEVLSFIKQNYTQNITLEMLANKANLNSKYLCHIFKQMTGRTPIDYLIYYRIECACEQLVLTNNSITEIALSCGFNDISYFSRKFNQLKNISPNKYREIY